LIANQQRLARQFPSSRDNGSGPIKQGGATAPPPLGGRLSACFCTHIVARRSPPVTKPNDFVGLQAIPRRSGDHPAAAALRTGQWIF
jgi:hypothetical protein